MLTDLGADLRTWLAAQSALGLTAGGTVFRGQFPQDVLEGVLVIETGGERSDRPTGSVMLTAQVTCRYRSLTAAMAMARAIYALLNEPSAPRTMGSTRIIYSKAIQPPFSLGQDERQAWRVICNYEFLAQT
jgi:hypothetical protein